jgi:hypothetical protein
MDSGEVVEVKELHYFLKWNKDYKAACELIYGKNSGKEEFLKAEKLLLSEAEKGNVLALFDLGKLYTTDKVGGKDDDKSEQSYAEALTGFNMIEPYSACLYPFEPKHSWQRAKPNTVASPNRRPGLFYICRSATPWRHAGCRLCTKSSRRKQIA